MYSYNFGGGYAAATVAGIATFTSFIAFCAVALMIVALWFVFKKAGKPGWHAIIPFLNILDMFEISWTKKRGWTTVVLLIVSIGLSIVGSIIFAITLGGAMWKYGFSAFNPSDYFALLRSSGAGSVGLVISGVFFLASGVVSIVAAIFSLISMIKLGKSFGKEGGFLVGMFFVPFVFIPILGFGKAQYIGPDGVYGGPDGMGYRPGMNGDGYYQGQGYYQGGNNQNDYYQGPNNQQYNSGQNYNTGDNNSYNRNDYQNTSDNSTAGTSQSAPKFCRNCGTPIPEGSKFCSKCGTQI
ncbi:MAG: zinc-ribbon domain-containing protein [Eubacterium sp.]|nr:zinc-ribbon domain-containing protein [Eubacterium sp.]